LAATTAPRGPTRRPTATDPFGRFAIQVNPGAFTTNGLKTIGVQATDASGTKGNIATFNFTLKAQLVNVNVPPVQPTIQLLPSDDSSGGLKITNVKNPHIVGVTDALVTVKLFLSSNGQPTGVGARDHDDRRQRQLLARLPLPG